VCPFLDSSDARCATHLTLANIARAFAHCADQYSVCPVYQALLAESISDGGKYEESASALGVLAAT
jgi:hypothetical protein